MLSLTRLIEDAKAFGSAACAVNQHVWSMEGQGGRGCPKDADHCSQAVYVCTQCGATDYGDKGGPGWNDCFVQCQEPDYTKELP